MPLRHERPVAGRRPDPTRPAGRPRRRVPAWPRIVGVAGMVAVLGGGWWALSDPMFQVGAEQVTVDGAHFTSEAQVRQLTGLVGDASASVFALATRRMETSIEQLPTVLRADVRAMLPDRVEVHVTEPEPIVGWRLPSGVWLVDVEGTALARLDAAASRALGDGWTGSSLPLVDDGRVGRTLAVGARLDPMDLAAVRLMGAITPGMIGSAAPGLALEVDDDAGFVLSWPGHWRAVFGHYSPTLLSTERIPDQVRCLAALLGERERTVDGATLAIAGDRCGTFVAGTPEPTPTRSPRPTRTPRSDDEVEPTRRPRATRRP